MGSDFSNNDIARADDLLDQYRHRIVAETQQAGHSVYEIESTPRESAPVVWGRERLKIRDDHLMLEHRFYDQDDVLIKTLRSLKIETLGGRELVTRERMQQAQAPEEWTEFQLHQIEFGLDFPPHTFSRANLRRSGF